ncbi:MAG: FAD-binding oxidoreductase [Bacteroidia bacterium]|nr:FAD-binding oxidoreductase [Bacteroidia bacterium]
MSNTDLKVKSTDFLIVGGGIAGTTLAWYLMKNGFTFTLISYAQAGEASVAASGVWNPLAMKRVNPGWKMKECLEELFAFTDYLEQKLGKRYHHIKKILHPLYHDEEISFWKKRLGQYPELHSQVFIKESCKPNGEFPFDTYIEINNCGWLDVGTYLNDSKDFFENRGQFINEKFIHSELIILPYGFEYKNLKFKKIVFCEGWRIFENPFFQNVKLNPAKGEELIIRIDNHNFNFNGYILNKQIIIRQHSDNIYIAGSTYRWDNLDNMPTDDAREELMRKASDVLSVPYSVVGQRAGIRPATHDRRPIAGEHPEIKDMYVFNGLGSKGVFLSPYMCREFINFIQYGTPLPTEASIQRFF